MLNPELIDADSLASQLALEELPPKLLITGRWPRPPSIYLRAGNLNSHPQTHNASASSTGLSPQALFLWTLLLLLVLFGLVFQDRVDQAGLELTVLLLPLLPECWD